MTSMDGGNAIGLLGTILAHAVAAYIHLWRTQLLRIHAPAAYDRHGWRKRFLFPTNRPYLRPVGNKKPCRSRVIKKQTIILITSLQYSLRQNLAL